MAAITVSDLFGNALGRVGEAAPGQLDENSKAARLCKQHYDQARRVVLASGPFVSARKRGFLARVSDPFVDGDTEWTYAYRLPADFLRVFSVNDLARPEYELSGPNMLTNYESVMLKYTADQTELYTLHPKVIDAIAAELAVRICMPLTRDKVLMKELKQEAQEVLFDAAGQDGTDEPHDLIADPDILEIRW